MSENKNAKTPADGPEYERGFVEGMQRQMQLHVNKVIKEGPTAWQCQCGKAYTVTCISSKPSKKEWVPLTDEEIQDLSYFSQKIDEGNSPWFDRWGFARAIEAKLKEKNHG